MIVLRAVFAGIGRILMAADRPAPASPAAQPPSSRFRSLDETGNVRLLSPQEVLDPREVLSAHEVVVPEDALGPRSDHLPLPNYDELSLASIRARLRGLDVSQLRVLLDHEAANAERAEVLRMFERRIEKLEAGG
jgi:hypothetical protein